MHPWSQCNAFLTHESPDTPFKAKSISDYLGVCIWSRIVVNAFRSEGLEPKTLKWHRVIRHALQSNYRLLIAQDSIVGWNLEESQGISSWAQLFPKTALKKSISKVSAECVSKRWLVWNEDYSVQLHRSASNHERTSRSTGLGLKWHWSPWKAFLTTQSLETHLEAKRATKYHKMCLSA